MEQIAPLQVVRRAALGLAAHGIGRAVQIDETAAAISGVITGLNGLSSAPWAATLVPPVPRLLE